MTILSIAPPRIGGIDLLLPLFLQLKKEIPGLRIHVAFLDNTVLRQLPNNLFLKKILLATTDKITKATAGCTRTGSPGNLFRKIKLLFTCWPLIFTLLRHRCILLHSGNVSHGLMRVLHLINHWRGGKTFYHFSAIGIVRPSDPARRKKYSPGDLSLVFSPRDFDYADKLGLKPAHAMGYPRLFPAWRELVCLESNRNIGLSDARTKTILILGGSAVPGIVSQAHMDQIVRETLACIKELMPKARVFFKPHPMQNRKHLELLCSEAHVDVNWTDEHPAIVAMHSALVISHFTSAILDAAYIGVPAIEYFPPPEEFARNYPNGTGYSDIGLVSAKSPDQLRQAIWEALQAPTKTNSTLSKILEHKMDLSPFLVFAKEK